MQSLSFCTFDHGPTGDQAYKAVVRKHLQHLLDALLHVLQANVLIVSAAVVCRTSDAAYLQSLTNQVSDHRICYSKTEPRQHEGLFHKMLPKAFSNKALGLLHITPSNT